MRVFLFFCFLISPLLTFANSCDPIISTSNGTDEEQLRACFSETFQSNQPRNCHTQQKSLVVRSTQIRPSVLTSYQCANPLEVLCQSKFVEDMQAAKKRLEEIRPSGERNPSVQNFIKKKLPNQPQPWGKATCYQLIEADDTVGFIECKRMADRAALQNLFSEGRLRKSLVIFKKAKAETIATLEAIMHQLQNQPNTSPETLREVNGLIKRVSNVRLISDGFQFNADAHIKDETINLHGLIILADISPEALEGILLHEFGHLAIPTTQTVHANTPLLPLLKCLKNKVAKSADIPCFERRLAYLEKHKSPDAPPGVDLYIQDLKQFLANYSSNPFYLYYEFAEVVKMKFPELEYCQQDQGVEALSDWFSVQAVARKLDYSGTQQAMASNLRYLQKEMAFRCVSHLDEVSRGSREYRAVDSHPLESERLAKIFLAHPGVLKSLGCAVNNENYCQP